MVRTATTRARLSLETLEGREVPATFTWSATEEGLWSSGDNWVGGTAPGATADVVIPEGTAAPLIDDMDGITVKSITIAPKTALWTPRLKVTMPLRVTNGLTAERAVIECPSTLTLDGGTSQTDGSTFQGPSAGKVILSEGASWLFATGAGATKLDQIAMDNYGTMAFTGTGELDVLYYTDASKSKPISNYGTIKSYSTTGDGAFIVSPKGSFTSYGGLIRAQTVSSTPSKLTITAPSLTASCSLIQVDAGSTLGLRGVSTAANPAASGVEFSQNTWDVYAGGTVDFPYGLVSTTETWNFYGAGQHYLTGWLDVAYGTMNVNLGSSPKDVRVSGTKWTVTGTDMFFTLDETADVSSRVTLSDSAVISGGSATVTSVNPLGSVENVWFSAFFIATGGIVGDFADYYTGLGHRKALFDSWLQVGDPS